MVLLDCTEAVTTLTADNVNKKAVLGEEFAGLTVHIVVKVSSVLRSLQVASTSTFTANEGSRRALRVSRTSLCASLKTFRILVGIVSSVEVYTAG